MDGLPGHIVGKILDRIEETSDRNSLSLTCKYLKKLDDEFRMFIRVGCRPYSAHEFLVWMSNRFPYLSKVEIDYSDWDSNSGKQCDDQGIQQLSSGCPLLEDITLNFCSLITNDGVASLASCAKLSSFKLISSDEVTTIGITSLVLNCKSLTKLHLVRCSNISSVGWLEYIGNIATLEDFCVISCKLIREGDLVKLGRGWGTLKRLHFELHPLYKIEKFCDVRGIDEWHEQQYPCKSMEEITLVNCISIPGRGLSCILGDCENLVKIRLIMCMGLRDSDIKRLAEKAKGLRSIFLGLPTDQQARIMTSNPLRITDESLKILGQNCSKLDSVSLGYSIKELLTNSPITLDGISFLMRMCPVKELSLHRIDCLNDAGMDALRSSSTLRVLRLTRCMNVTDAGIKELAGSRKRKLEELSVEDCPWVSKHGVQGVAESVFYRSLPYGG